MNKKERDELILKHYREQAELSGGSILSTMPDETIRKRELGNLVKFASAIHKDGRELSVLDAGCGNGYALGILAKKYPKSSFVGVDLSPEMLSEAKKRNLKNMEFAHGDVRDLKGFSDGVFDFAYTIRCLINVLTWDEQCQALEEIHRVLKPGGYYLLVEYFDDGLENLNRARGKFGLPPMEEKYHNKYLPKDSFLRAAQNGFVLENSSFRFNYLSSYYFVSRAVYPALAKLVKSEIRFNTKFVKFFSHLPPIGEYSPAQIFILKKI